MGVMESPWDVPDRFHPAARRVRNAHPRWGQRWSEGARTLEPSSLLSLLYGEQARAWGLPTKGLKALKRFGQEYGEAAPLAELVFRYLSQRAQRGAPPVVRERLRDRQLERDRCRGRRRPGLDERPVPPKPLEGTARAVHGPGGLRACPQTRTPPPTPQRTPLPAPPGGRGTRLVVSPRRGSDEELLDPGLLGLHHVGGRGHARGAGQGGTQALGDARLDVVTHVH